jgi:hypothetical protein
VCALCNSQLGHACVSIVEACCIPFHIGCHVEFTSGFGIKSEVQISGPNTQVYDEATTGQPTRTGARWSLSSSSKRSAIYSSGAMSH